MEKPRPIARKPIIAINGTLLAVFGRPAVWTGGGTTTSVTGIVAPVGVIAMIGASLRATAGGSVAVLIGATIYAASSSGMYRTGTFVVLANSTARFFGYTNS